MFDKIVIKLKNAYLIRKIIDMFAQFNYVSQQK
jgi:hypothetical protein